MSDLTIKEMAQKMGVSEQTVRKMIKAGAINSYKPTPNIIRIPSNEYKRISGS